MHINVIIWLAINLDWVEILTEMLNTKDRRQTVYLYMRKKTTPLVVTIVLWLNKLLFFISVVLGTGICSNVSCAVVLCVVSTYHFAAIAVAATAYTVSSFCYGYFKILMQFSYFFVFLNLITTWQIVKSC